MFLDPRQQHEILLACFAAGPDESLAANRIKFSNSLSKKFGHRAKATTTLAFHHHHFI